MPFLDTREHGADYSTIADLQFRQEKLLDELDQQAPHYAKARQIAEFIGERKKSALADAFCAIRKDDPEESATAAEHRARASLGYKAKMQELMKDHLNAENAITHFHLLQTRLDNTRTQLTVERTKLERGL